VILPAYHTSTTGPELPTADAAHAGAVPDATAPSWGQAYTQGGAVPSLLFCNGTGWETR
jgi:hypothetical protein